MNQSFVSAVVYETFNTAALAAGYAPVNANGFDFPIFMLRLVNASGQVVSVSYDGVNDHDVLTANSSLVYAFQTNNAPNGHVAMIRKGTVIYVAGVAGAGTFYVIGYYLS